MKGEIVVSVADLAFRFESAAAAFELAVRSLQLRGGELVAVYGPNGVGKTTLIRLLARAAQPERGNVRWERGGAPFLPVPGRDLVLTNAAGPFPHLTVDENLRLAATAAQSNSSVERSRIAERWGLAPLLKRLPHQLSAGQAQRVVLARTLLVNPDVFLLDEVESAQSQAWAKEIGLALRELADGGRLVVVISHDPVWVIEHATRVIELGEVGNPPSNGKNHVENGTRHSRAGILYDGEAQRWPKLRELQNYPGD